MFSGDESTTGSRSRRSLASPPTTLSAATMAAKRKRVQRALKERTPMVKNRHLALQAGTAVPKVKMTLTDGLPSDELETEEILQEIFTLQHKIGQSISVLGDVDKSNQWEAVVRHFVPGKLKPYLEQLQDFEGDRKDADEMKRDWAKYQPQGLKTTKPRKNTGGTKKAPAVHMFGTGKEQSVKDWKMVSNQIVTQAFSGDLKKRDFEHLVRALTMSKSVVIGSSNVLSEVKGMLYPVRGEDDGEDGGEDGEEENNDSDNSDNSSIRDLLRTSSSKRRKTTPMEPERNHDVTEEAPVKDGQGVGTKNSEEIKVKKEHAGDDSSDGEQV